MTKISAVIITKNEERNIGRCIHSLEGIADEIIVVDNDSTDKTVEIASGLGARVMSNKFTGFGEQKHFAQSQASNEWILSVDADEEVSSNLKESILSIKEAPKFDAYRVNILTNYCGKWIKHSGWYPSYKIRLWNRNKGSISQDKVHEEWFLHDTHGQVGTLKGDLHHYSYNTISEHIRKIELYSEIGALSDVEKGKHVSLLKLWFMPKWLFFSRFIFRGGFLDGYYGYLICKSAAFYAYVKYAKTRQYSKMKL